MAASVCRAGFPLLPPADPEVVVDADILDAVAALLAGLVLSLALGLTGCDAGGGSDSATRPTTERSGTLPAPSGTESPTETTTEPTRPPRTTTDPPTSAQPPTTAAPAQLTNDRTGDLGRDRATTAPATSTRPNLDPDLRGCRHPSGRRVPGAGQPLAGPCSSLLVVALVGGWLLWRSRQRSAWDTQAAALEADTATATGTQLPPVLTAQDAGQRALSWPPLRATLVDLMGRWDRLAEPAPDDQRRTRTSQLHNLLQELVAAVDAENQALATGRDWRLLRPRVDQAQQMLSAVLAGLPQPEPPPGGEPRPPPPGGGPPS